MISNKYGFVFIHTPKTGGTSINAALDIDLDHECRVTYGEGLRLPEDHILSANYADEITHIYPSATDFPWWDDWILHTIESDEFIGVQLAKLQKNYNQNIAFQKRQDAECIFSVVGWTGNIKHMPLTAWQLLFYDSRFRHYGSFRDKYYVVGTCRNPYEREWSTFLYYQNKELEEKAKSLNSSQISALIKKQWEVWTSEWKAIKNADIFETGDLAISRKDPRGYGSQCQYLMTLVGEPPQPHLANYLIRMENIKEDYDTFCKAVGIKRKTKKVPHLLSINKQWKKYLPNNILDWYADEMLADIHRTRQLDFELLGYPKVT